MRWVNPSPPGPYLVRLVRRCKAERDRGRAPRAHSGRERDGQRCRAGLRPIVLGVMAGITPPGAPRGPRRRQARHACRPRRRPQPRPTKGMFVAMTVSDKMLASRGSSAMWTTAAAAWWTSIIGSLPVGIGRVCALPMSIWPQAMA